VFLGGLSRPSRLSYSQFGHGLVEILLKQGFGQIGFRDFGDLSKNR
jgi:hypothetical protein